MLPRRLRTITTMLPKNIHPIHKEVYEDLDRVRQDNPDLDLTEAQLKLIDTYFEYMLYDQNTMDGEVRCYETETEHLVWHLPNVVRCQTLYLTAKRLFGF